MRKRNAGFSILEVTIALAIVMLVLFAAINFFVLSVRQYKVQTKITETNLEGLLGLEILRRDLNTMGVGLPWNNLPGYAEVTSGPAEVLALNDSPNAPRAVVSIDCGATTVNHSDYLVIRSAAVGMSPAAGKWTNLTQANVKRTWTPARENLQNSDYVIVLTVGSTDANRRSLVNPGTFYTQYNNTAGYVPTEPYSANIIYGIDNLALARPFNRADYFISTASVPVHCAPGTGVLVKQVLPHGGSTPAALPLMDCVADLKVVYGLDNNGNGMVDPLEWASAIPSSMSAEDVRAKLLEVDVAVLAQEGQRDVSYTTPTDNIFVGAHGWGRVVDVSTRRDYRWKTYTIAVKPMSLAQ